MELYTGISFILLLCVSGAAGERLGCPEVCTCPQNPPCPPGAPRVPDTCGCGCEVCIQDAGTECDGLHPCDPSKKLTCDYQTDGQRGLCKEPRSCDHNGSEIQHGQEFRVACDSYCKCEDGHIECEPLCPDSPPPVMKQCSNVKPVTVPGECCKQWRCLDRPSRFQGWKVHQSPDAAQNETTGGEVNVRTRRAKRESELPLCKMLTDWTPCSRSCGFGSSVRIVHDEKTNSTKPERRLCMIRPCKGQYRGANYTVLKSSNVCNHVIRWTQPMHLRYRDCLSYTPMTPKFCGHCSDGRLCRPLQTETRWHSFTCGHLKEEVTYAMMWVTRCQCGGRHGKKKALAQKAEERGLESGEEATENAAGDH